MYEWVVDTHESILGEVLNIWIYMPAAPMMIHRQAIKTIDEDQIKKAMDLIAKKGLDTQVLMYNMQNSSTVEHQNADLREWLAGMTDYGYGTLIERLDRM